MLNGESSTYAIEDGSYTFDGVFTCGQTPADLLNTSSKFGEKYGEKDVPNVLEMMSAIIELYCCEKTEFGQKIAAAYLKDEKLEVDTPVRSYTLSRNDAKESDKLVVEDDKKVEEVVEEPEVKMPQHAAYLCK
uniref:Uncharacterized protein n=1 Tax=Panagrolaimus sp. JU765 TaxID=591449 RepID=A0AC34RQT9_9BILA